MRELNRRSEQHFPNLVCSGSSAEYLFRSSSVIKIGTQTLPYIDMNHKSRSKVHTSENCNSNLKSNETSVLEIFSQHGYVAEFSQRSGEGNQVTEVSETKQP